MSVEREVVPEPPPPPGLPTLAADEVQLLQLVWDALDHSGSWPTFEAIDRTLLRIHDDIDLPKLINRIPIEFLQGGRPPGGARPDPNGSLSLTVAGAAACSGTEQVLQVVVAAARLGAAAYRDGDPGQPAVVTFGQVVEELGLDLPDAEKNELGRRSSMLIDGERWFSQRSVSAEGSWTVTVTRDIWFYKGVTTFAEYLAARERQLRANEAPPLGGPGELPTPLLAGLAEPYRLGSPASPTTDQAVNVTVTGKRNSINLIANQARQGSAATAAPPAAADGGDVDRQSLGWTKGQTYVAILSVIVAVAGTIVTVLFT